MTAVENGVLNQPAQTDETPRVLQLRNQWKEASSKDTMALQVLQTDVSDLIFSRIAPLVWLLQKKEEKMYIDG